MTPFGVTGNERVKLNPGLETRILGLEIRNPGLETRFIGLESRNPGLETRILGLETRFIGLETQSLVTLLRHGRMYSPMNA